MTGMNRKLNKYPVDFIPAIRPSFIPFHVSSLWPCPNHEMIGMGLFFFAGPMMKNNNRRTII